MELAAERTQRRGPDDDEPTEQPDHAGCDEQLQVHVVGGPLIHVPGSPLDHEPAAQQATVVDPVGAFGEDVEAGLVGPRRRCFVEPVRQVGVGQHRIGQNADNDPGDDDQQGGCRPPPDAGEDHHGEDGDDGQGGTPRPRPPDACEAERHDQQRLTGPVSTQHPGEPEPNQHRRDETVLVGVAGETDPASRVGGHVERAGQHGHDTSDGERDTEAVQLGGRRPCCPERPQHGNRGGCEECEVDGVDVGPVGGEPRHPACQQQESDAHHDTFDGSSLGVPAENANGERGDEPDVGDGNSGGEVQARPRRSQHPEAERQVDHPVVAEVDHCGPQPQECRGPERDQPERHESRD